jgi:hypothetical protein
MHQYYVHEVYFDEDNNEVSGQELMQDMEACPMAQKDNSGRDALTGMPDGCMIFNTSVNKLQFWNGTDWETITSAVI